MIVKLTIPDEHVNEVAAAFSVSTVAEFKSALGAIIRSNVIKHRKGDAKRSFYEQIEDLDESDMDIPTDIVT